MGRGLLSIYVFQHLLLMASCVLFRLEDFKVSSFSSLFENGSTHILGQASCPSTGNPQAALGFPIEKVI